MGILINYSQHEVGKERRYKASQVSVCFPTTHIQHDLASTTQSRTALDLAGSLDFDTSQQLCRVCFGTLMEADVLLSIHNHACHALCGAVQACSQSNQTRNCRPSFWELQHNYEAACVCHVPFLAVNRLEVTVAHTGPTDGAPDEPLTGSASPI